MTRPRPRPVVPIVGALLAAVLAVPASASDAAFASADAVHTGAAAAGASQAAAATDDCDAALFVDLASDVADDTGSTVLGPPRSEPATSASLATAMEDEQVEVEFITPTSLIVDAGGRAAASALASALEADPAVADVVADVPLVPAAPVPSTTSGSRPAPVVTTWQLVNEQLATVRAPVAWATTSGERAIRVAVFDDAVDLTHPALVTPTTLPPGVTPIDERPGSSPRAHGTHVAGIIAGAVDDQRTGVAPGITLLTSDIYCASQLVTALSKAVARGTRIVNLSLVFDYGGRAHPPVHEVQRWTEQFDRLLGPNTLLVAAAGNTASPVIPLPGAVDLPQVLTVNAVDGDRLAAFSNHSPTRVALAAPGRSIRSTAPGGGYATMSGTSMAAPHVAGAAALAASLRPDASAHELSTLLTNTARKVPALRGTSRSGGVLDAGRAVEYLNGSFGACPAWMVPSSGFHDVDRGAVHGVAIDCLSWWGVAKGRTSARFDPRPSVTRAEMATFLARVLDHAGVLPPSAPDAFDDDDGLVHERAINRLAARGVVLGTTDGVFRPAVPVTRAQMAAFLERTANHVLGELPPPGRSVFRDIDASHHRVSIETIAALGIAEGTRDGHYRPEAAVTRAQMASFLSRLLDRGVDDGALVPRL